MMGSSNLHFSYNFHDKFFSSLCQDDRSRAENDDLDHAIALSLAEDAKKRNGMLGIRKYELKPYEITICLIFNDQSCL